MLAYTFELAQVLRAGDQGAAAAGAGEHRPRPLRAGGGRPRAAGARSRPCRWSTSTRARRCRSSAATWPTDGRMVGIVVDPDGDLTVSRTWPRRSRPPAWCRWSWPPTAGRCRNGMAVQRTFGATRSVEFDAVLAGRQPGARRRTRSSPGTARRASPRRRSLDPRVVLLLQECFRHAKAIGAWGAGVQALELAGIGADDAGVVTGDEPERGVRRGARAARRAPGVGAVRHGAQLSARPIATGSPPRWARRWPPRREPSRCCGLPASRCTRMASCWSVASTGTARAVASGVTWLDEPGRDDVGGAAVSGDWPAQPLPDIHGLALRVPDRGRPG